MLQPSLLRIMNIMAIASRKKIQLAQVYASQMATEAIAVQIRIIMFPPSSRLRLNSSLSVSTVFCLRIQCEARCIRGLFSVVFFVSPSILLASKLRVI